MIRRFEREPVSQPRVVFVPISVAWAYTPDRGWHVIEDPAGAIDMDRLCDWYDELDARDRWVVRTESGREYGPFSETAALAERHRLGVFGTATVERVA